MTDFDHVTDVTPSSDASRSVGDVFLGFDVSFGFFIEEVDKFSLVEELNKRQCTFGIREAPSSV